MNRFQHHHRDSILFGYSCFDRLILNGSIVPFMHTARAGSIVWFLRTHRHIEELSRAAFARISRDYHNWVREYALQTGVKIVEPEKGARPVAVGVISAAANLISEVRLLAAVVLALVGRSEFVAWKRRSKRR